MYTSYKFNVTIGLIGAAFCWIFFPILNQDVTYTSFVWNNGAISTIYAVSSCVFVSVGVSLIAHGKLNYRDIITAPIAGGVIVGSSSIMIYNPMEAIILGAIAGVLQVALFNWIERKVGHTPLISNGVFFLFGVQGLLGGLASAVLRAIVKSYSGYSTYYDKLTANNVQYDQRGQISATFISLGIAVLTGLVVGAIMQAFNAEEDQDFYHDRAYWLVEDDGISGRREPTAQAPPPVEEDDPEVYEGADIKAEHAYL